MQFVSTEWQPTSTAPSDRELEICALDFDGIVHALPDDAIITAPNEVMLRRMITACK
jgi:hypothetical protein